MSIIRFTLIWPRWYDGWLCKQPAGGYMDKVKTLSLATTFLKNRVWDSFQCEECGRLIFFKPHSAPINECSHDESTMQPLDFQALSKKNKFLPPAKMSERFDQFFLSKGFVRHPPRNLINEGGNTDLVIAGVQIFDEVFHSQVQPPNGKFIVSQPSVRMQFVDKNTEGSCSSAFVNICTESLSIEFEEHLNAIDDWISFLSSLGLNASNIVLVCKVSKKDWGFASFDCFETTFLYGGLEIGDGNYAFLPLTNLSIPMSDLGFGLERIAWAINKNKQYYELLAPFSNQSDFAVQDFIRTATLLAMSGLKPGPQGSKFQLRKLCKKIAQSFPVDLEPSMEFYYDYWSKFISPKISVIDCKSIVKLEIDRLVNIRMQIANGFSPPKEETIEQYATRLVYENKLNPQIVRFAIQSSREELMRGD